MATAKNAVAQRRRPLDALARNAIVGNTQFRGCGPYIQTVRPLKLTLLAEPLAVCRLSPADAVPPWASGQGFHSITRTAEELSIVCAANRVPPGIRHEPAWRAFQVEGPLPFTATGILAAIAAPLAAAEISIFAISTFDTDYVLVKEPDAGQAAAVLAAAGHLVGATSPLPGPPPEP